MDVTIVRHGIAVPIGAEDVMCDENRILSKKGREKTQEAARGLRVLGCRPDTIYTSPLVRAVETAEIMAVVLKGSPTVEVANALAPGHELQVVHSWLARLRCDHTTLVGHMPDIADLTASLIGADDGTDITFKKSGACRISFFDRARPGKGSLKWLLQPRALRALARLT